MEIKVIEHINLTQELVDQKKFFTLGYCEALETYLMAVLVPWIVDYNRYYRISAEEYHLYQNDSQAFCKLYEKEISRGEDCFTQKFIGAGALRDYDGRVHFTRAYPSKEVNPFVNYIYYEGVLYARILWDKGIVYVPPYQKVKTPNGYWEYPLRKECYIEKDLEDQNLCFCLDTQKNRKIS